MQFDETVKENLKVKKVVPKKESNGINNIKLCQLKGQKKKADSAFFGEFERGCKLIGAAGRTESAANAFQQANHLVGAAAFNKAADTLQISVAAAVNFRAADNAVLNIKIHPLGADAARRVRISHVFCSFLCILILIMITRYAENVKLDFQNTMPEDVYGRPSTVISPVLISIL